MAPKIASVAELADALDSKSSSGNRVSVRPRPEANLKIAREKFSRGQFFWLNTFSPCSKADFYLRVPQPATLAEMIFRQATPSDLPQLRELLQLLFSIETDFHFDAEKVTRGLELFLADQTERAIWVACEGESILGMCSAQLFISTAHGAPSAWIEDVILRPEARGQGIMPQLMGELERWCRSQGVKRWQILCDQNNAPALAFYPKNGFQSTQLICLQRFLD